MIFYNVLVSDTCASGEKIDESGPGLREFINNAENTFQGEISSTAIVQDVEVSIMKYLIQWSDQNIADVILTTGGTGFSERDVTPEATKRVIHKETPGLSLNMLMSSLKITPMAILSR